MATQQFIWRLGASGQLSNQGGECSGCSPSGTPDPWHNSWGGNRPCMGIDVAAAAGDLVYVAGKKSQRDRNGVHLALAQQLHNNGGWNELFRESLCSLWQS